MELRDLPVVQEVRVKGLMVGVECSLDPKRPDEGRDTAFSLEVDRICQEQGLLLRPVYATSVMSPPLTITEAQIDALEDIFRRGLEKASAKL